MELREHLEHLKERWLTVALCGLAGLCLGAGLSVAASPQYTAASEVVVVTRGGSSAAELLQSADFSRQQVRSYSAIAVRPVVLDPVIAELELSVTADELARRVSVTSPLNTQLMTIAVTDESPARAARIANAIAEQLSGALHDITTTGEDEAATVRLVPIRAAEPPASASAPNVQVLLGLGLLGGLVAGLCLAALAAAMTSTVRRPSDLLAVVEAPYLGGVARGRKSVAPAIADDADPARRGEAYRQLRTSIRGLADTRPRNTWAITSAVQGEGRTTTAANLAVVMAATGKRVCLVETDMRAPVLAKSLDMPQQPGLAEVLTEAVSLSDVLRDWRPRVAVLPAGAPVGDPSELLDSLAMAQLLADLSSRYDTIILDCAPVLPVTDATVVAAMCGGAILVVGAGVADRRQVAEAQRILEGAGAPVLGVVLNLAPRHEVPGAAQRYRKNPPDGSAPRRAEQCDLREGSLPPLDEFETVE